jgi:MFS family permease
VGGGFNIAILYAVVVLQGLFGSLQSLSANATVAPLTLEENRHRVNAVREMLFPLASIAAPPIAGLLFFRWGLLSVIAFDLATYLASMAILAPTQIPRVVYHEPGEKKGIRGNLEGFRYLRRNKNVLLFAAFFGILNFLWNGPLELITPYLIAAGIGPSMLSLSVSFMSIGVLMGAGLLAVRTINKRGNALFAFAVLWNGVWMLIFGMIREPILMVAALFFMMMPLPVAGALFNTELQNRVPNELQGRVFSVVYQISGGTAPLSFLLVGPLTDRVLTPMMRDGSSTFLWGAFGSGEQAGMGLVLSASGFFVFVLALLFIGQSMRRSGSR